MKIFRGKPASSVVAQDEDLGEVRSSIDYRDFTHIT
jgi:hypothetical protein